MVRLTRVLVVILGVLVLAGCSGSSSVRIGAKDFTEQEVLAEMLSQLAEANGLEVERIIPVPENRLAFDMLRDGDLDAYVEYTGTALALLGEPPLRDRAASLQQTDERLAEIGIDLLDPLGFANDYVMVVTPGTAATGLTSLSNLADLAERPRFAIDREFRVRPLDGYQGLLDRYGLRPASDVFVGDKDAVYEQLLDGRVDVAQGFATDSELVEFDLFSLDDDLGFFPAYEAAPIVRSSVLERSPELGLIAQQLAGRLDEDMIRELVRQVDLDGRYIGEVATGALAELGLVSARPLDTSANAVRVAVGIDDDLSGGTGRAIAAIRKAYPGRTVRVERSERPADVVVDGDAQLAIVEAEVVFEPEDLLAGRNRPRRALEAIASVETRAVHLITRSTDPLPDAPVIDTGAPGSSDRRTAELLRELGALAPTTEFVDGGADIEERIAALTGGSIDAVLFLGPPGHSTLQRALATGSVELASVTLEGSAEEQLRAPHIRPGEIKASFAPGQMVDVQTVYQQAVIVGPATPVPTLGLQGPGAGGSDELRPISGPEARAIASLLESNPRIDPALPRSPELDLAIGTSRTGDGGTSWVSLVSFLVLASLVGLVLMFQRLPPPDVEPEQDGDEARHRASGA